MKKSTLFACCIFVACVFLAGPGFTRSTYKNLFNTTYGTVGTVLDTCALCHPGLDTGSLNGYGQAYITYGSFSAIEPLDSDGDGASNIDEINALTFPGDASSTPAPTSDAMPLPVGGQAFPLYAPVNSPVISTDPAAAMPVALANVLTNENLADTLIGLGPFEGAVDVYFGVYLPDLVPDEIFLIASDNSIRLASQGFVPWRAGTTGDISETPLAFLPTPFLPAGRYFFYLAVTPANDPTNAYLWGTMFEIP